MDQIKINLKTGKSETLIFNLSIPSFFHFSYLQIIQNLLFYSIYFPLFNSWSRHFYKTSFTLSISLSIDKEENEGN